MCFALPAALQDEADLAVARLPGCGVGFPSKLENSHRVIIAVLRNRRGLSAAALKNASPVIAAVLADRCTVAGPALIHARAIA